MLRPTEHPTDLNPDELTRYHREFVGWYGGLRCNRIWNTDNGWRMCALLPDHAGVCRYLDFTGQIHPVRPWQQEILIHPPIRDPDDTVYLHRPDPQHEETEPDDDQPPAPLLAILFAGAVGLLVLVAYGVAAVFALP